MNSLPWLPFLVVAISLFSLLAKGIQRYRNRRRGEAITPYWNASTVMTMGNLIFFVQYLLPASMPEKWRMIPAFIGINIVLIGGINVLRTAWSDWRKSPPLSLPRSNEPERERIANR